MAGIIDIQEAIKRATSIKAQGQSIVLVGGCFDLIHLGHITFLEEARKQGGVLMVMLESDENIKLTKGDGRPINSQNVRARILSHLDLIDFVIQLPIMRKDQDYDHLIS